MRIPLLPTRIGEAPDIAEGMTAGEEFSPVFGFLFEEVMPRLRNPLRAVFILASMFVTVILAGFRVVSRHRATVNIPAPGFLAIGAAVITAQSHFLLLSLVQSAWLRYVTIQDPVLLFLFVFVVFLAIGRFLKIRS